MNSLKSLLSQLSSLRLTSPNGTHAPPLFAQVLLVLGAFKLLGLLVHGWRDIIWTRLLKRIFDRLVRSKNKLLTSGDEK